MAVSSIGVVAVTPTTAVSKPALEPMPERTAPVFQASSNVARNGASAQTTPAPAPAEQSSEPDPAAVARIRGTGLVVDKSA